MASAQKQQAKVPAGLRVLVTAELPPAWDHEKRPVLEGTVQSIQALELTDEKGTRTTHVAHVANKDGVFGLWESATLKPLFAGMKQGDNIYVRYEGRGDRKPGRDAPKLFTAGVVEPQR